MFKALVLHWHLLVVVALLGCPGALPPGLPDAMDPADSGLDGGVVDAGPQCPAGAHVVDDGGCDATLTWQDGPPAATPLNHHVTFIDDSTEQASLYVLGGISGPAGAVMLDAIVRASLDVDGGMGAWADAGTLLVPRAGFTLSRVGQTLMVVSGLTQAGGNLARARTTEIGQIQADGSLGPWRSGPPVPESKFHAGSATVGNFTYVFGGIGESGVPTNTVHRSTFDGGTFGAWQLLAPLPAVRSHQAVVFYRSRVYLIAGLQADTLNASDYYLDVLSSEVSDAGELGPWQTASTQPLSTPVSTEATFVKDGWLYLVGGIGLVNGTLKLSNAVLRAPMGDDGMIGAWETMAPLPRARGHVHQTPLFENTYVYSVGGTSDLNHDSIPNVYIGTFQ